MPLDNRHEERTEVHILTLRRHNRLDAVIDGYPQGVFPEVSWGVIGEMKVYCIVITAIIPREVWVVRNRVADIVNCGHTRRHYRHTTFLDTATIVFLEDFIIAVVVWLHHAVASVRDSVGLPGRLFRRTRTATTPGVKYWDRARGWVVDIDIAEVFKIEDTTKVGTSKDLGVSFAEVSHSLSRAVEIEIGFGLAYLRDFYFLGTAVDIKKPKGGVPGIRLDAYVAIVASGTTARFLARVARIAFIAGIATTI